MTDAKVTPAPAGTKCPLQPLHPLVWLEHAPVHLTDRGASNLAFTFDHMEMGLRVIVSTDAMDPGTFGERGGPYHHLSISAGYDRGGKFFPVVRPGAGLVNLVLDDFMPAVIDVKVYEVQSPTDPNVRHFFRKVL